MMELPLLVIACDLFVYLNVHFRSLQFEEVHSSQIFVRWMCLARTVPEIGPPFIMYIGAVPAACCRVYLNMCIFSVFARGNRKVGEAVWPAGGQTFFQLCGGITGHSPITFQTDDVAAHPT